MLEFEFVARVRGEHQHGARSARALFRPTKWRESRYRSSLAARPAARLINKVIRPPHRPLPCRAAPTRLKRARTRTRLRDDKANASGAAPVGHDPISSTRDLVVVVVLSGAAAGAAAAAVVQTPACAPARLSNTRPSELAPLWPKLAQSLAAETRETDESARTISARWSPKDIRLRCLPEAAAAAGSPRRS